MGLEHDSDDFPEVNLKLLLVLVLLLEDLDVFLVEGVLLISFGVLLLVLVVLRDSVLTLLDEAEDLVGELVDRSSLKKIVSRLFNDLFDSLSLNNEAVGFSL